MPTGAGNVAGRCTMGPSLRGGAVRRDSRMPSGADRRRSDRRGRFPAGG